MLMDFYSMLRRRGGGWEWELVCKDVTLSSVSSVRFSHNNGTVVNAQSLKVND